jgi:hypothetical protein
MASIPVLRFIEHAYAGTFSTLFLKLITAE